MSELTKVPVPPPPPPKTQSIQLNSINNVAPSESKIQLDECLWAAEWPELQKACYLARVCPESPPKDCQFRIISGQLQIGPTCGLTALSMLLNGDPTAEELLKTARELKFTNNGELFSADYLYQLALKNLKQNSAQDILLYKGVLDSNQIRQHLKGNACIFVPYDPDVNHAPCLKRGHKAHWALVIGFLETTDDEFFVLARHGKAKNLAVWSLKLLSDSNANLLEYVQPKDYPDLDFLLPPGGIAGDLGLNERAVIVKTVGHKVFDFKSHNL